MSPGATRLGIGFVGGVLDLIVGLLAFASSVGPQVFFNVSRTSLVSVATESTHIHSRAEHGLPQYTTASHVHRRGKRLNADIWIGGQKAMLSHPTYDESWARLMSLLI